MAMHCRIPQENKSTGQHVNTRQLDVHTFLRELRLAHSLDVQVAEAMQSPGVNCFEALNIRLPTLDEDNLAYPPGITWLLISHEYH